MTIMTAHTTKSKSSHDESTVEWVLKHWVIIAFLVAVSASSGVIVYQTNKIDNLDAKVQALSETVARIDERTTRIAVIESKIDTLVMRTK